MLGFGLNVAFVKSIMTETECSAYVIQRLRNDFYSFGIEVNSTLNDTKLADCFDLCRYDHG